MIWPLFTGVMLLAVTTTKTSALSELDIINIITTCLYKVVKNEPINLVHAFQLPTSYTEKCFAKCCYIGTNMLDKSGNYQQENSATVLTMVYGQKEKIEKIAAGCQVDMPRIDVKSDNCTVVQPFIDCMDKYATEYGLDRKNQLV